MKKRVDHLDQTLAKLRGVRERLMSLPSSTQREKLLRQNHASIEMMERHRIESLRELGSQ